MARVEPAAVRVGRSASLRVAARIFEPCREAEARAAPGVTAARVVTDDSTVVRASAVAESTAASAASASGLIADSG